MPETNKTPERDDLTDEEVEEMEAIGFDPDSELDREILFGSPDTDGGE